jgi:hypothetical protein
MRISNPDCSPRESTAEKQLKLQPALQRSSAMFQITSRPEGAMLGLDFAPANSALDESESGACSWGTATQTEQNREYFRLIILLRKRQNHVSGKGRFFVRRDELY